MQLKSDQIVAELNKYGNNCNTIICTYEIKGVQIQLQREISSNGSYRYKGFIVGVKNETANLHLIVNYTFEVYPRKSVNYEILEEDGSYAGRFYNNSAKKHVRETCRALATIHNIPNIDRLH